jgi:hypothetical protein
LLVWLIRGDYWSVRSVSIATVLVSFWILTAIGRAFAGGADSSRYLYVDCLFAVLLAAELARGKTVSLRVGIALAFVTAAAVISNIGSLRDGGAYLRASAAQAKADLAALNISRSFIGPSYVPTSFPGYPFIVLRAGQLSAAERSLGDPGYTPAELASAPGDARARADAELVRAERVTLTPASTRPILGSGPAVEVSSAAAVRSIGSCVSFRAGIASPGQVVQLQLTLPAGGVWLAASGGDATVGVRRFGSTFQPSGTLASGGAAIIRVAPDDAPQPWHLQLVSAGRATVCGLSG